MTLFSSCWVFVGLSALTAMEPWNPTACRQKLNCISLHIQSIPSFFTLIGGVWQEKVRFSFVCSSIVSLKQESATSKEVACDPKCVCSHFVGAKWKHWKTAKTMCLETLVSHHTQCSTSWWNTDSQTVIGIKLLKWMVDKSKFIIKFDNCCSKQRLRRKTAIHCNSKQRLSGKTLKNGFNLAADQQTGVRNAFSKCWLLFKNHGHCWQWHLVKPVSLSSAGTQMDA